MLVNKRILIYWGFKRWEMEISRFKNQKKQLFDLLANLLFSLESLIQLFDKINLNPLIII